MKNGTEPLLKILVAGDIQGYAEASDWGFENLKKGFAMLAGKKPDVLVMPGDLADLVGSPGVYEYFNSCVREYFPDKIPELVACSGNHDLWNWSEDDPVSYEDAYRRFVTELGLPEENPSHQLIGGYDFITIHENDPDLWVKYTPDIVEKLEKELEKAAARDKNKPIFVISHFPPKNTMPGSFRRHGKNCFRDIFNRFPQVISLSGHTHYPVDDERAIWQGEFTAITTGTLSYACIDDEDKVFNLCNSIVPFAREAMQVLYMEIFEDHLDIHRYNVTDQREIKPEQLWQISLPYVPADAVYDSKRAEHRTAPYFPENTELITRYDFGYVYVIFDCAEHPDMVHYYMIRITIADENGDFRDDSREVWYLANFYRSEKCRGTREFFKMPGDAFQAGKFAKIEVFPVETFGKMGNPLTAVRKIPQAWTFRPVTAENTYPQE